MRSRSREDSVGRGKRTRLSPATGTLSTSTRERLSASSSSRANEAIGDEMACPHLYKNLVELALLVVRRHELK